MAANVSVAIVYDDVSMVRRYVLLFKYIDIITDIVTTPEDTLPTPYGHNKVYI